MKGQFLKLSSTVFFCLLVLLAAIIIVDAAEPCSTTTTTTTTIATTTSSTCPLTPLPTALTCPDCREAHQNCGKHIGNDKHCITTATCTFTTTTCVTPSPPPCRMLSDRCGKSSDCCSGICCDSFGADLCVGSYQLCFNTPLP